MTCLREGETESRDSLTIRRQWMVPDSSLLPNALPVGNVFQPSGRRRPDGSLAVGESLAAVLLRPADAAVPAVDAHLGRLIAQVVTHAAVGVPVTRLAETHRIWQMIPGKPSEKYKRKRIATTSLEFSAS